MKLFGVARIRGRRYLEGGAYFKVIELNNIKCQSCHFFIQNKNETNFYHQENKYNEKSKYQQYFSCFVVCILLPYAFWFDY